MRLDQDSGRPDDEGRRGRWRAVGWFLLIIALLVAFALAYTTVGRFYGH